MNYVFIDHTDFRSKGDISPDIFLMGALVISENELEKLTKIFRNIVGSYSISTMPVKWNFKDLKKTYRQFGKNDEYKNMLSDSYKWRKQILDEASNIDYTVSLSIVENFQKKKKGKKPDLIRYSFSNLLMRIGLIIKNKNQSPTILVADWPDKDDRKPYEHEYFYGYNRGESLEGIEYYCGKLRQLNFFQSILFANSNHSIGLQFIDILIGGFSSGYKAYKSTHYEDLGITISGKFIKNLYRGKHDKEMGYGVTVSKNNRDLQESISHYIEFLKLPF